MYPRIHFTLLDLKRPPLPPSSILKTNCPADMWQLSLSLSASCSFLFLCLDLYLRLCLSLVNSFSWLKFVSQSMSLDSRSWVKRTWTTEPLKPRKSDSPPFTVFPLRPLCPLCHYNFNLEVMERLKDKRNHFSFHFHGRPWSPLCRCSSSHEHGCTRLVGQSLSLSISGLVTDVTAAVETLKSNPVRQTFFLLLLSCQIKVWISFSFSLSSSYVLLSWHWL